MWVSDGGELREEGGMAVRLSTSRDSRLVR